MIKSVFDYINKNGIVSSLIASVIFALILFLISRDTSILTYEVITNQKLFESSNNEALIILNKDSQQIKQDIYYLEIDVWNQGNKEIKLEDIKENFILKFEDEVVILGEFKIEETHPKVSQSKVKIDSLQEKIIIINKYLEKGNGVKLMGYYSSISEKPSEITHKGYITKGGQIKCYNKSFSQKYSTIIVIVFLVITSAFAYYSARYVGKFISDIIDKYIDKEKYKNWNSIAYIAILIPVAYFFLFKFVNNIPRWIKEFLENYFNPESPFNL